MNTEGLINLLNANNEVVSYEMILFNFLITTILGFFIYFVYKKTFSGVLYSQNFNVTILMISLITSMVMMLIGTNLVISLGMVGALSIVRFRTAIKEPRDIGFLFWAIAIGLATGSGSIMIAIVGSLFIAVILFLFSQNKYTDYAYLLVIKGENFSADEITTQLKNHHIKYKLRMKTKSSNYDEATYEVKLFAKESQTFVEELQQLNNITEVILISYNGEISG